MNPTATYVALLTPPGRSALATIEVRGPEAWQYTQACLDQPIGSPKDDLVRPWLRRFRGQHGSQEELIVSLPAIDTARIHCHGGLAACESILQAIISQGATQVAWQQFANPERIALADARTERTALLLLDQCRGAFRAEIMALIGLLNGAQVVPGVVQRLDELLARAQLGLHLTSPWRVVIAGRPNAGKSSLLNALLGYQRAIIHDQPGTTRDVVTARTAFDGWPVELRDTAGLRDTKDELEAAGVERAENEIRSADLVLYVIPADYTAEERAGELAAAERLRVPDRKVLVVRSKCDLAGDSAAEIECSISARTGEGLAALISGIVQHLVPEVPAPGTPLPFSGSVVDRLKQARAALLAGKVESARCELQAALRTSASPCDSSNPARPLGA
jgi:tRNA modification GTPase